MEAKDIKKLRQKMLMTNHELAKALGVTQATVSSWETGKRVISIRNQRKLKELAENNGIEWSSL